MKKTIYLFLLLFCTQLLLGQSNNCKCKKGESPKICLNNEDDDFVYYCIDSSIVIINKQKLINKAYLSDQPSKGKEKYKFDKDKPIVKIQISNELTSGYNVYKMNPFSIGKNGDAGSIFIRRDKDEDFYVQGEGGIRVALPDYGAFSFIGESKFTSKFEAIKSVKDIQDNWGLKVNIQGQKGVIAGALNTEFNKKYTAARKDSSEIALQTTKIQLFELKLTQDVDFDPYFIARVNSLPEDYDEEKYRSFLESFGTHYAKAVSFGQFAYDIDFIKKEILNYSNYYDLKIELDVSVKAPTPKDEKPKEKAKRKEAEAKTADKKKEERDKTKKKGEEKAKTGQSGSVAAFKAGFDKARKEIEGYENTLRNRTLHFIGNSDQQKKPGRFEIKDAVPIGVTLRPIHELLIGFKDEALVAKIKHIKTALIAYEDAAKKAVNIQDFDKDFFKFNKADFQNKLDKNYRKNKGVPDAGMLKKGKKYIIVPYKETSRMVSVTHEVKPKPFKSYFYADVVKNKENGATAGAWYFDKQATTAEGYPQYKIRFWALGDNDNSTYLDGYKLKDKKAVGVEPNNDKSTQEFILKMVFRDKDKDDEKTKGFVEIISAADENKQVGYYSDTSDDYLVIYDVSGGELKDARVKERLKKKLWFKIIEVE